MIFYINIRLLNITHSHCIHSQSHSSLTKLITIHLIAHVMKYFRCRPIISYMCVCVNMCMCVLCIYMISGRQRRYFIARAIKCMVMNLGSVSSPLCVCETRKRYVVKHNLITEVNLMTVMETTTCFGLYWPSSGCLGNLRVIYMNARARVV